VTVTARTSAQRGYVGRRLLRRFSAIVGGVLLTVASAVGMLIAIIPAVMLMGIMGEDPLAETDRAIMGRLGVGWLLAVAVTISGSLAGSALLRRRRGMVLWLRRFGNKDAMLVVQAALDHIGRSWRVVTLDDSFATPIGVAAGLRASVRVVSWVNRFGKKAAPVIVRWAKASCGSVSPESSPQSPGACTSGLCSTCWRPFRRWTAPTSSRPDS